MSTTAEIREAQRAFLGLLERPLVTPATDAALHRQIVQRQQAVTDYARRVGYRIQRVGHAVRLIRVPIDGEVTAPPRPADAPSPRLLSLACRIAACCEEISGAVTLQRLSDMVRDLTAAPGVQLSVYDPDDREQRKQLRDAAAFLAGWGVLRRRTSDERLLDEWTESGAGPGAGYEVDRHALLLMTSPDVLALALNPEPGGDDEQGATRTLRHLRALLETPYLAYADLPAAEADALRMARGLRAGDLSQMTGGTLEARAEGLLLVLDDDEEKPATVADWPKARAADWVALLAADQAGRDGTRQPDGTVHLTNAEVDAVIDYLIDDRGDYMNKPQKGVPGAARRDAETLLTELGLLTVAVDGSWTLAAAAGRYRDPTITFTETGERTR
ncbi:TIGR02678 family protein [Actinoplanes sp. NPDC024001]|uniref:TIGR02678 family protein n=1 Tax=Actinoplanes sp. NPDC024001 TaxID=3154598 RepID=UPI0033FA8FBF